MIFNVKVDSSRKYLQLLNGILNLTEKELNVLDELMQVPELSSKDLIVEFLRAHGYSQPEKLFSKLVNKLVLLPSSEGEYSVNSKLFWDGQHELLFRFI